MWEELLRAAPVYFASMLKFVFGPLGGYAAGLQLITTIVVTVAGTMTVVLLLTFAGDWIRLRIFFRFFGKPNKFSARSRKFVGIWKRYGLIGVAFLTPLLLTPIGGTLLAVSSGSPKEKIILYMFISASAWSVLFSFVVYFFGNEMFPDYLK